MQKQGGMRLWPDSQMLNQTPVSCICATRHSFIHMLIQQIVTKSWALGPLGWKKTALCLPRRVHGVLGNHVTEQRSLR